MRAAAALASLALAAFGLPSISGVVGAPINGSTGAVDLARDARYRRVGAEVAAFARLSGPAIAVSDWR